MKHRDDVAAPQSLTVFDGRHVTSYEAWWEAFDALCTTREAWQADHPESDLPELVKLGVCPDGSLELPHGGLWSRPDHSEGVRCAEHNLRPGEH